MDPAEREKAGYKSHPTVSVKPSPNPAATVIVRNVSFDHACAMPRFAYVYILIDLLFLDV
jgi:hypothetical protein